MQVKIFFSKKLFLVSGILFFISQVAILIILFSAAPAMEIFWQQTTFSTDEFQAIFSNWGPENIRIFLFHYYLDFIHPLLYAVFLSCCIFWAWPKNNKTWLLVFPIVTAITDEIENLCQLPINLNWLPVNSIWFYIGAASSRIKWIFAGFTLVAIGTGLLWTSISKRNTDY